VRIQDRLKLFVLRVVQSVIAHQTKMVVTGLQRAEASLSSKLAAYLDVAPEELTVRMKDFPDGTSLPSIELRTQLSDFKLAKIDHFFDNLAGAKLNVRPAPRSQWN
jgi:hypothetical protein